MKNLLTLVLTMTLCLIYSELSSQNITIQKKTNTEKADTLFEFKKDETVFIYNTLQEWESLNELVKVQDEIIKKQREMDSINRVKINLAETSKNKTEKVLKREIKLRKMFTGTTIGSGVANLIFFLLIL